MICIYFIKFNYLLISVFFVMKQFLIFLFLIGIVVDWLGRNIYWMDLWFDIIEVVMLNGSYRCIFIFFDLVDLRVIIVDLFIG